MIRESLARLVDRSDLSRDEARALMGAIMDGEATPAQLGAILGALQTKGSTAEEITGFAEEMRERAVRVDPRRTPLVDVVGTGGDRVNTFNVSTAAGVVAAAAGAAVAKHGNRAASSRCGSADVLEALGVQLERTPEAIARSIDELGFGFMFARAHHPAMRHAAPVRQELGVRTVFNVLGPLANPAGVRDGVFGVYDASLTRIYADALAGLGARHAFVVHGDGGLDELSPFGPSLVLEVVDGEIVEGELDPRELGIYPGDPDELRGGDPATNAAAFTALLAGERSVRRDAVLLNAAAALVAAGLATELGEGLGLAAETVDSGAAGERLEAIVRLSVESV
jgi:anthranilate phosphoribosyltransferase